MKTKEAAEILKKHNSWRRGETDEMQEPKKIGEAIDRSIKIESKVEILRKKLKKIESDIVLQKLKHD